ncbi:DUF6476 family protein [Pararhodobacter zhoushanensis]|uniref:DUF6476 family protein n=1 Tax=Pararhodobacter zhoushanensis TaxID=2479545 RepID=A0ABT3H2G9_9RHOB|nr:DUF6476 family protein [Pararhodobacter zhoushanensis]MCW1933977.1 DUF6476 family protein [Pararhodobacter zhoushanensis]
MSSDDDIPPLPADLRFLKLLVTTLAGVMIVGLVTITGLLVTRLSTPAPLPVLPETISLPDGATAAAVTFARDWLVVVTEGGEVLLYGAQGGAPVSITPLP